MARGTTFNNLVEMVREECRRSTSSSRGIDNRAYIERVIKRHYETLYDDYEWPFLKVIRDINISAGQRYYDFPTDLNFERMYQVSILDGDAWVWLPFGITDTDYTAHDSDNDDRSDPILKYDVRYTTSSQQLEVWPMPASNVTGGLRLRGIKTKTELVANSSRCDIDDLIVVLFASADVLTDAEQSAAAKNRLGAAQARLSKVRSLNKTDKSLVFGQSEPAIVRGHQRLLRAVYNNRTP